MEVVHVLVFPFPAQGHINPMLQFAKRLVSKGVRVTLINTKTTTDLITLQSPSNNKVTIETIQFPEGAQRDDKDHFLHLFETLVSQRLAKVIEDKNDSHHPAQFLVYDSIIPWALDVARRSGIDAAPFFTQPWAVNAVYYHLHEGRFKVPLERPVLELPSMPVLEASAMPSFISDHPGPFPSLLQLLVSQFSNLRDVRWLFTNTFYELEHELITWMESQQMKIKPIGPTIPSMYLDKRLKDDTDYGLSLFKPIVDDCIKWLDLKESGSVVYVAFGSLAALGEEQMHELAWGLRMSNLSFLWVVRETEQSKLPKDFVEETSDQGMVISWSPQLQVLGHRAVGCFVTHCGWNSTLEALCLGVPMVGMPQWSDQPTNAKFVSDVWEVGVTVKVDSNGKCRKDEIDESIREVMEGKRSLEIKKRACKWKEMAVEAVSEGGSSDKNINDFVAFLHRTHTNLVLTD